MDLHSATAVILFVLGGLTVTTIALVFGVLQLSKRMRGMERVLYKLAGEELPRNGKSPLSALVISLTLMASMGIASSPREAYAAAYKDIRTVPGPIRKYQRYLTDYHTPDEKQRIINARLGDFWVNSLSRRSQLRKMVRVVKGLDAAGNPVYVPGLYRINLLDYNIPSKVYEKLAGTDPYLHTRVEVVKAPARPTPKPVEYETKKVPWEGGVWPDGKGIYYEKGAFMYEKKVPKADAPSVVDPREGEKVVEKVGQLPDVAADKKDVAGLALECDTQTPILRLDWFIIETSQQTEREGTGYFDFLEIKNRKDFDAAVGLDQKLAEKFEKEVRAVVQFSGVALNNRQIVRFQTITGGYWKTLDVVKQTKRKDNERRNAVRNLDSDFVHDAEEIYGVLPNGLFAYFAGDAKGNRQDSVPDTVASDKVSPGNEARIAPYSCIGCHKEGIRPIDDYARKVYKQRLSMDKPDVALTGPDYEKQYKLQRLYLEDLEGKVKLDQVSYANTLQALTGMTPLELSNEWTKLQRGYRDTPIGSAEIARELGVTQPALMASLKTAALTLQKQGYYLDPSFVGLLQDPPVKMRRDYLEDLFQEGLLYVNGVVRVPSTARKREDE